MSYPNLPNNRLIVGGVDLSTRFNMILSDGYTLNPPEPKTYVVDIPGGNGKLDLTDSLLGDTAYDNRKQEFEFYIFDVDNFEKAKTEISNYLHGRSFDYEMTMDPGYIYTGRFTISSYKHEVYGIGIVGIIKVSVDAKPFKRLPDKVFKVNAVGGQFVYLDSGRMRVRPIIESDGYLKIGYKGKMYTLTQGTWRINDILFEQGINEIYFNSYNVYNLTWGGLKTNNVTWKDFKEKRLFEWYKSNGDGTLAMKTWEEMSKYTWNDCTDSKWSDYMYMADVTENIKDVYIKYEWGDL